MTPSARTWVLVADSHFAKIFEVLDARVWTLQDTLKGDSLSDPNATSNFGPKASEHKGALHAHGEAVPKETQERRFAHLLTRVLEKGHGTHAFNQLVLVAPPKLLGDLRENLNRGLQSAVVSTVNKDCTHSTVEELMALVGPMLQA